MRLSLGPRQVASAPAAESLAKLSLLWRPCGSRLKAHEGNEPPGFFDERDGRRGLAARGLDAHPIALDWKSGLGSGCQSLASPAAEGQSRGTADLGHRRNESVAALTAEILFAQGTPGGRLDHFVRHLEEAARTVTQPPGLPG